MIPGDHTSACYKDNTCVATLPQQLVSSNDPGICNASEELSESHVPLVDQVGTVTQYSFVCMLQTGRNVPHNRFRQGRVLNSVDNSGTRGLGRRVLCADMSVPFGIGIST